MSSSQTMTNNINTILPSYAKHDCNTLLSSYAKHDCNTLLSSYAKHDCNTPKIQPPNLATVVLSNSQFFKHINEYIELQRVCDTCTKIFNLKKYVNYRLTKEFSLKYYVDEKFRSDLVKKISNPGKQLYLDLSERDDVIDVSVLENVHYLDFSGCKNITDISPLKNVHTLMFCGCKQITVANINTLKNVNTMFFSLTNITDMDDILLEKTEFCYANIGLKFHRIFSSMYNY